MKVLAIFLAVVVIVALISAIEAAIQNEYGAALICFLLTVLSGFLFVICAPLALC